MILLGNIKVDKYLEPYQEYMNIFLQNSRCVIDHFTLEHISLLACVNALLKQALTFSTTLN